jgi:thiol-disulfide isomerase/thioredoxin
VKLSDRQRRFASVLVALAALQVVVVGLYLLVERTRGTGAELPFRYERVTEALRLPAVDLVRPDGSSTSTTAGHGQPTLLHFWATWCRPCRDELPGLLRLSEEHPGLRVIALTVDEEWATVGHFFDGAIPTAVFRDPSGRLVKRYGVGELPDSYLLDAHGVARLRMRGARDWTSRSAAELLRIHGR